MSKKKKCPECPKCLPGWLVQFGDLMSLLLTFFILLLSMAVMDKKKVEEYFDIMKKAMGFLDKTSDVKNRADDYLNNDSSVDSQEDKSNSENSINSNEEAVQEISNKVKDIVENRNNEMSDQGQMIEMSRHKNAFILDIPSSLMFKKGEYKIYNMASKRFIAKITKVVRTMFQTFSIEVIGYTSSDVNKNKEIPRDDWDLSALRSIEVVKEFIKYGIDPAQLKVSALASYHPRSEITSENRRVEIKFFTQDDQSEILDKEMFFDRLE